MSQLDDLLKSMGGGQSGGAAAMPGGGGGGGLAALLPVLAPVIASMLAGGGLQRILQGMQQKGMSSQAASWVGTGENEAISPGQVKEALGEDAVKDAAAEAGISEDDAANDLAALLPQVVDKITAGGQVPDQSEIDKAVSSLQSFGK